MTIASVAVLSVAAALVSGCDKVEDAGRKAVRKTGDLVGKGVAEFASGVGEGVKNVTDGNLPDVMTAITTRKSVRKFDPSRTVDDALVEKLLRAAMAAPTAVDRRPWEFIVVRDEAKLKALGEALPLSRISNGARLAFCVCGSLDNGLPDRAKEYWIIGYRTAPRLRRTFFSRPTDMDSAQCGRVSGPRRIASKPLAGFSRYPKVMRRFA